MLVKADSQTIQNLEMLWHSTETIATSTNPLVDYSDCFRELAKTLAHFNCGEHFEIVLLHRHFDVAEGEFLFEYPDSAGDWYLTAKPSADFHDDMVPLTLKFTAGGEILGLVYAERTPEYQDPAQYQECLDACSKIIRSYKLENSLGIGVNLQGEQHWDLQPWNEFRLSERVMKRAMVPGEGDKIPTHFRLGENNSFVVAGQCFGGTH